MRRVLLLILAAFVLLAAYATWPLHAAMQIRQALMTGDTATLERRIEWESVRASMKASLQPETIVRLEADPNAPPPTTWQRIKASIAPRMASTVIDRYVTPENLPSLFGYRQVWRGTVQPALGISGPPSVLAGTFLEGSAIDRFATFWKRLRRGVIHSPARMTIEVEDARVPGRTYIGTLELKNWEWKLTQLSVGGVGL